MKLIFRTEEYKEMEFNFQNHPANFFVVRCRCQTRYFTVITGDLANERIQENDSHAALTTEI